MKTKLPPSNLLNNIYFDLKQKTQKMLTGIAFGDKEQLDFIGLSSINDQLDLVSGHGEWKLRQEDIGNLFFENKEENKHSSKLIRMKGPLQIIISRGDNNNNQNNTLPIRAISLKKQPTDGSEFARPLAGDGEKLKTDLSKCTNFFLITKWISYNENTSSNNEELPSILTTPSVSIRRTVCALVDECTIDINQIIEEENKEKKLKDLPPASSPEFAQSVDISGKGDPCRFIGPTYSIEWWIEINEKGEEIVNFLMKQKQKKGNWWSAIGIGDNMSDMDIGAIFLENGEPKAMIDYFSNNYEIPSKDTKQDWKLNRKLSKWPNKLFIDENNSENNKNIELYFSRKFFTEDIEKDKTMDGCVLFQFGANLGEYGPPGFRLHKHQDWPDLYKACEIKKYCLSNKRQNGGGNNRNNFVRRINNIPTLSHSIDEKLTENNLNNNLNNSTDKAIQLLMKSIGPKIVEAVLESEKEIENSTNKQININKKIKKEKINEENNKNNNNGTATIIPLFINSKQQNNERILISEADDNEMKQNENNKTSINLTKRQEQKQQTINNSSKTKNETNGGGLSTSPFSLSAFIGGSEQQQNNNESLVLQQLNKMEKGEISSENGISSLLENINNTITPKLPPRFGISQMLQEEKEEDNNTIINLNNLINNLNQTNISSINLEENNNNITNNTNVSNDFITTLVLSNENQTTTLITPTNFSNNEAINQTTTLATTEETSKNITENLQTTTNLIENNLTNITSTDEIISSTTTQLPKNVENNTLNTTLLTNTTTELTTKTEQKTNSNTIINVYRTTKTSEKLNTETTIKENLQTIEATTKTLLNTENNKNTNISSFNGENSEESGIKLPVVTSKCDALRPDLPICRSYMDTYIERVKNWSDRHGEPLEKQFPKACRLLSAVPHIAINFLKQHPN
ncbi:DOMON domain-containing protein [Meloidogyne graminicola]|uniref:DOMON domain-containing protein n=1 Tax=Meloidogyne graminicola TaxID=189291 RepID=A0A8S9ZGW0_9BILA|nr:DOMON domain-containing protein [Meloidogyne graminicola]